MNRKILEEKEAKFLAPYAVKSKESAGRKFKEKNDDSRLCFQKDKDRIIHCKAFRRLDEKTQVFIAGSGDHYRTRLTHTLEVAQMSRDIARRLGLNEDLCEAIALAHDLGHPPFGHGGEEALDEIMREFGMNFEHNAQSRRIVEKLEKSYPDFDGLNLSIEVLDGLIKHQTSWDQSGKKFEVAAHLEGQVVNIADEIAYTNHDLDDGLRGGVIDAKKLEKIKLWKIAKTEVNKKYEKNLQSRVYIPRIVSTIISMMIEDFCKQTNSNLQKYKIHSVEDVRKHKGLLATFSPEMMALSSEMRHFLYKNFYMNPRIWKFVKNGERMIKKLFEFYMKNPDKFSGNRDDANFVISVKDYIAGMTDGFLEKDYDRFLTIQNN